MRVENVGRTHLWWPKLYSGVSRGDQTSENDFNEADRSHRDMDTEAERKRIYEQAAVSFLTAVVRVSSKNGKMLDAQLTILPECSREKNIGA